MSQSLIGVRDNLVDILGQYKALVFIGGGLNRVFLGLQHEIVVLLQHTDKLPHTGFVINIRREFFPFGDGLFILALLIQGLAFLKSGVDPGLAVGQHLLDLDALSLGLLGIRLKFQIGLRQKLVKIPRRLKFHVFLCYSFLSGSLGLQ